MPARVSEKSLHFSQIGIAEPSATRVARYPVRVLSYPNAELPVASTGESKHSRYAGPGLDRPDLAIATEARHRAAHYASLASGQATPVKAPRFACPRTCGRPFARTAA
jgi:hypothetical protein